MTSKTYRATLIEGDGIGPEITDSTVRILEKLGAPFIWEKCAGGLGAIESSGVPLPEATLESISRTGLALKGPLTTPVGKGFKSVNVTLRQRFGLYANLRPTRTIIPGERFDHIDLVVVRENIEGLYAANEYYLPLGDDPRAIACGGGFNSREECARIIRFACDYAVANGRKKVTLVHKANILKIFSGLFLETGRDIAQEYDGKITIDERIVDACAMQLVTDPWQFDVIVTTNLFGDILSDLTAGLVGGLGMAPGANIGEKAAIFEAVHGSAPDIAGKNVANPLALLMAGGLMLAHVGRHDLKQRLDDAITRVVTTGGVRTRDLGGTSNTSEITTALLDAL